MSKNVVCYTIILTYLFTAACLAKYSGGTGEPNDPYLIATPNDLNAIGTDPNDWNKNFKMIADINLIGYNENNFNMIGYYIGQTALPFKGTFDGNEHVVKNFHRDYDANDGWYVGLFGYVSDSNAEIKNVGLFRPTINKFDFLEPYIGCLVGYLESGIIENCFAQDVNVFGEDVVGGLVGLSDGVIEDCWVTGTVSGKYDVGGLIGKNDNKGIVKNCYSEGDVISFGTASGGLVGSNSGQISLCYSKSCVNGLHHVGGFAGYAYKGNISQCFSVSDVNGFQSVGGFTGIKAWSNISDCYAEGAVSGNTWVGGFVGENVADTHIIVNSFTTVTVISEGLKGGFIGRCGGSPCVSCFWDADINPDANGIGYGNDPNVIGLPTAEMQRCSTFADAGWDMVNVWDIGEGQTYPFLRTHLPSDINKDDETNFLDLAIQAAHWLDEK